MSANPCETLAVIAQMAADAPVLPLQSRDLTGLFQSGYLFETGMGFPSSASVSDLKILSSFV